MKRSWLFSLAAMLCTTASIAGLNRAIAGNNDIDLTQWTPPDIATVAGESLSEFTSPVLTPP